MDSGVDSGADGGADGSVDGGDRSDDVFLDRFFSLEAVHQISIEVGTKGYESLLAEPREYISGSVQIDGDIFDTVAVRLKGGAGSFVALDGTYPEISGDGNGNQGKSAFIIDFNRYTKGLSLHGLEKLTINNLVQDPSGIHEYLGYKLFREGGVPASRTGFATVLLNGEDKGLYALIEPPDNDEFLKKWFDTSKGNLYEGEYGADISSERVEMYDQDHGEDKSKKDLAALAAALKSINGDEDVISVLDKHFGLDAYLDFAATEIFLGHWDGYAMSANNYNIHHNTDTDKWNFIPWGLDQLFIDEMGRFNGVMTSSGPSWSGSQVHSICISSSACRTRLHQAFLDLFERVEKIDLAGKAGKARKLVEEYLLAEAKEHGDPNKTTEELNQVTSYLTTRKSAITEWLPCLKGDAIDNDMDTFDACKDDCNDENENIHPDAIEECNFVDDNCNSVLDEPDHCPKCRDETAPNGRDYLLCFEEKSWDDASSHCQSEGKELASMHSEEEWDHLTFTTIEKIGTEETWIGLNDLDTEGEFVWTDGTPNDYYHWSEEAPQPDGHEDDCVTNAPWGWRDTDCEELHGFICQAPL
jgi:CotH protein/lectin-like protein/putative metal-binding protein